MALLARDQCLSCKHGMSSCPASPTFLNSSGWDGAEQVQAGVDLDGTNECGETAALIAAMLGHVGCLRLLAWAGASLQKPANGGGTPASTAAARGHGAILELLRTHGLHIPPRVKMGAGGFVALTCGTPETIVPRRLITAGRAHPGAGSVCADGGLSEAWLTRLTVLWESLPVVGTSGGHDRTYVDTCAERRFFCDADSWVAVRAPCRTTTASVTHFLYTLLITALFVAMLTGRAGATGQDTVGRWSGPGCRAASDALPVLPCAWWRHAATRGPVEARSRRSSLYAYIHGTPGGLCHWR